jgi:hypothetical protein
MQIGSAEQAFLRTRPAVIEDMLVEQLMELFQGDSKPLGGFLLREQGFVGGNYARHSIALKEFQFYLLRADYRIG